MTALVAFAAWLAAVAWLATTRGTEERPPTGDAGAEGAAARGDVVPTLAAVPEGDVFVVTGIVVDEDDGTPIEGAVVIVLGEDAEEADPAGPTPADGTFRVRRPHEGSILVCATRSDRPPSAPTWVREGDGLSRVLLPRGAAVEGSVTGADGRPLAGGVVEVAREGGATREARVGADGLYRVDGCAEGFSRVTARRDAGASTPGFGATARIFVPRRGAVHLDLGGGERLHGRVVRRGRPVAGAIVIAVWDPSMGWFPASECDGWEGQAATDSEGRFDFAAAPAPAAVRSVRLPSGSLAFPTVGKTPGGDLVVVLPGAALAGRVTAEDTGRPLADVVVVAVRWPEAEGRNDWTAVTGSEGAYSFGDLPAGRWFLYVGPRDMSEFPKALDVDPPEGVDPETWEFPARSDEYASTRVGPFGLTVDDTKTLDVALPLSGSLRIQVVDGKGRACPFFEVLGRAPGRKILVPLGTADAEGRVLASTLAPGTWTLVAREGLRSAEGPAVVVRGETREARVVAGWMSPGSVLVTVTGASGMPVDEIAIKATPLDGGEPSVSVNVRSVPFQPGVRTASLSPGRYELFVSGVDHHPWTGTVEIEPGETTAVDVHLLWKPPDPPMDGDDIR